MAPFKASGFTLIELLIVVAIIAILAAIAVPNFLEAQVRAKVSRVKSDIRTIVTAAEAYAVDANHDIPHLNATGSEIPYPDRYTRLTTPVSYLSSLSATMDVFYVIPLTGPGGSDRYFSWTNLRNFPASHPLAPVAPYHRYMIRSRGPDAANESNAARNGFLTQGLGSGPSMVYDPTNGSVSRGDILRTAVIVP